MGFILDHSIILMAMLRRSAFIHKIEIKVFCYEEFIIVPSPSCCLLVSDDSLNESVCERMKAFLISRENTHTRLRFSVQQVEEEGT